MKTSEEAPPAVRLVRAVERTRMSSLVASAIGAVLLILLAVVAVFPHPTAAGFVGLAIVAVCGVSLYRLVVLAEFAPVAITFWSFVLVWVGLAPLLQIRDDRLPWPDSPLHSLWLPAQLMLLGALVLFAAGYARGARTQPAERPGRLRSAITVADAAGVTVATFLLACVAIPLTGGLRVRFADRDAVANALAQAGITGGSDQALAGILNMLPAAAGLAALVLCLRCWKGRVYADGGTVFRLPAKQVLQAATVLAVLLNIVYNNPLSASRFISLSTVLAAVLALVDFNTLRRRALFTLTIVGGLAVVYPLADALRNANQRSSLRLGAEAYYTYDFDGFQQTVNALYYSKVHGPTWGHHILSAVLFFVPRSIWEGKAMPAGFPVAASRGYTFQNLSMPLWAELFVEFWWVGLIVMYFYGRLARRLDVAVRTDAVGFLGALAVIFAATQIGLLRGPLGAQLPFVATALIVAAAARLTHRPQLLFALAGALRR